MARLSLLLLALVISGCEAHYRYPCQNPDNWNSEICKEPLCEVDRTCPKYIFKEDAKKECK